MTVDDEQADAGPIARPTGRARRDDQLVGPRRADHRRLGSAQDETVSLAARGRHHIVEIIARASLRPGERPYRASVHDRRQEARALLGRANILDQAACENDRLEIGLDNELAAELLHYDHGRKRATAKPARALLKWCRAQAELGKGAPVPAAKALIGRDDLAAFIEIILIAQKPLNAGTQQFLLFRQLNIHRMPSCDVIRDPAPLSR